MRRVETGSRLETLIVQNLSALPCPALGCGGTVYTVTVDTDDTWTAIYCDTCGLRVRITLDIVEE